MLKEFAPEIWIHDGPVVTAFLGFRYPTRMAVIRLEGGRLLIWSPTELTGAVRDAVGALGTVAHIVAPNALHDTFLAEWAAAFPEAALHAAPGLAAARADLAFASELGDDAPEAWAGVVDQVVARGNRITTEVVFLHRPSGTVLIADLLQQLPKGWHTGWRALVARLDLMTAPEPSVPRKFRMAFRDRDAAREAIARILAWPAQKLVIAHGPPVEKDAAALLDRAFAWLMRS